MELSPPLPDRVAPSVAGPFAPASLCDVQATNDAINTTPTTPEAFGLRAFAVAFIREALDHGAVRTRGSVPLALAATSKALFSASLWPLSAGTGTMPRMNGVIERGLA
jgi:hypothetical protein